MYKRLHIAHSDFIKEQLLLMRKQAREKADLDAKNAFSVTEMIWCTE